MPSCRQSLWPAVSHTVALGLAISLPASGAETAVEILRGKQLATQAGCAQCHTDLPQNSAFRSVTPDLGSAGLRYQPAWLFEFLQNPSRVRHHLGAARMPAFPLSAREALALTAYLETQRQVAGTWPDVPAEVAALDAVPRQVVSKEQFHAELSRGLACLTCHDYEGKGGHRAVELTNASLRLRPEWVTRYLVAPAMFGVHPATMPAQFFQLTDDRAAFREFVPGATRRIQLVKDHLFSLNGSRRATLEQKLAEARRQFPEITPAHGEILFRALNCAACHRHPSIAARTNAAPPLAGEGLRVQHSWLTNYLARPAPVRPFGHQPGDGGRMPDFRLAPDEVRDLGAFLLSQREGIAALKDDYKPRPRSAFALRKASLLFAGNLSCLGCHRFGGQGGRIGPDLTQARHRLRPSYVLGIIRDPRVVARQSIMPHEPLPDDSASLIADYLLQGDPTPAGTAYLSPLEYPLTRLGEGTNSLPTLSRAPANYARYCAACHGSGGRGDGFNATFLPVKPTPHAEGNAMSARPDDTLFDGIHAGGRILNKSHFMPAWGTTLSAPEIRELVTYIRALCRCQGPGWSRDDAK